MLIATTALLGLWLSAMPAADPSEVLAGSWWINGNGSSGTLAVEVAEGNVTGTVYGQPIVGTFDAATGRVTFVRKLDPQDAQGVQEWTGVLSQIAGKLPPRYSLTGVFRGISNPEFGKPGVDYAWHGDAVRLLPPTEDVKNLQGRWEVSSVIRSVNKEIVLPSVLALNEPGATLEIDGNRLRLNDEDIATFANDISVRALADEVGFPNFRLLVLTLPNGQGLVCSYILTDGGIEIAYPHTTSCHRGSGQIVYLKRPRE